MVTTLKITLLSSKEMLHWIFVWAWQILVFLLHNFIDVDFLHFTTGYSERVRECSVLDVINFRSVWAINFSLITPYFHFLLIAKAVLTRTEAFASCTCSVTKVSWDFVSKGVSRLLRQIEARLLWECKLLL